MSKIALEKPAKFFDLLTRISTDFTPAGSVGVCYLTTVYYANEHEENTDLFQSIQHPYSHAGIREQSF